MRTRDTGWAVVALGMLLAGCGADDGVPWPAARASEELNAADDCPPGWEGPVLGGGQGPLTIDGGDEAECILGSSGADVLNGGGGNDHIVGGKGADAIFGGSGDDYLVGGKHADVIEGGEGRDVLIGNKGADRLYGHLRNDGADDAVDLLFGRDGNDELNVAVEGDERAADELDALHPGRGTDHCNHHGQWCDPAPVAQFGSCFGDYDPEQQTEQQYDPCPTDAEANVVYFAPVLDDSVLSDGPLTGSGLSTTAIRACSYCDLNEPNCQAGYSDLKLDVDCMESENRGGSATCPVGRFSELQSAVSSPGLHKIKVLSCDGEPWRVFGTAALDGLHGDEATLCIESADASEPVEFTSAIPEFENAEQARPWRQQPLSASELEERWTHHGMPPEDLPLITSGDVRIFETEVNAFDLLSGRTGLSFVDNLAESTNGALFYFRGTLQVGDKNIALVPYVNWAEFASPTLAVTRDTGVSCSFDCEGYEDDEECVAGMCRTKLVPNGVNPYVAKPYYVGPGIYFDPAECTPAECKLYVRLQLPELHDRLAPDWENLTLPAHPNGAQMAIAGYTWNRHADFRVKNSSNLLLRNIDFRDLSQSPVVESSVRDLVIEHSRIRPIGRLSLYGDNLIVRHVELDAGIPHWLYYSDMKENPPSLRMKEKYRFSDFRSSGAGPAMWLHSLKYSILFSGNCLALHHSTLENGYMMVSFAQGRNHFVFRNDIDWNINDTFLVEPDGEPLGNVHIYRNFVSNVRAGVTVIGAEGRFEPPGSLYVYENVIDMNRSMYPPLINRYQHQQGKPVAENAWVRAVHSTHGSASAVTASSKVYNNTLISHNASSVAAVVGAQTDVLLPALFVNNIVYQDAYIRQATGGEWITEIAPGRLLDGHNMTHEPAGHLRTHVDGNLYYREGTTLPAYWPTDAQPGCSELSDESAFFGTFFHDGSPSAYGYAPTLQHLALGCIEGLDTPGSIGPFVVRTAAAVSRGYEGNSGFGNSLPSPYCLIPKSNTPAATASVPVELPSSGLEHIGACPYGATHCGVGRTIITARCQ